MTPKGETTMPVIVAVGGLDPGGRSGLVRDFLTGEALGARVLMIGTAWTLQTLGLAGAALAFHPRPKADLRQDLTAAISSNQGQQLAVKVGMIADADLAGALVEVLTEWKGPVVYDPVLAASSGGSLYRGALTALDPLIRRATLVTPNLAEAAALTGLTVAGREDMQRAGQALLARGARAVLCKGGHLDGAADDLLMIEGGHERRFSSDRLPGPSPRGTGCALATAIAGGLARGWDLEKAVGEAKAWLHKRIAVAPTTGGERHL